MTCNLPFSPSDCRFWTLSRSSGRELVMSSTEVRTLDSNPGLTQCRRVDVPTNIRFFRRLFVFFPPNYRVRYLRYFGFAIITPSGPRRTPSGRRLPDRTLRRHSVSFQKTIIRSFSLSSLSVLRFFV